MITLAWYLLKVIICSCVLFGYYYVALRNKIFHRWNRFYLLAAIVISLTAPIIEINIWHQPGEDKGTTVRMLQAINTSDEIVIEYSRNSGFKIESEKIAEAVYFLVSASLLAVLFISFYKISRLRKNYPETKMREISFISTDARGTPFSFFNSIFWNNAIDLHSSQGQKIFNHEIAHVKEKHSYDKLFMNVVLIFFWANPFFWLMRRELNMIHEFIADQKAVEDNDISGFADMILHTVYPGQNFSLINTFFYSPLKRRILMLTQNKNPKVSYLGRLLALPLAAIIFFAFTLKMKTINSSANYEGKQITVVIDAGHGGNDYGARSVNGSLEKNISLSIAKEIAALNSNKNITILLSRSDDNSITMQDRVQFAETNNADLFISIHVNAVGGGDPFKEGFSVLIDKANSNKNKLLASALIEELQKSYTIDNIIAVREHNVYVVDKNICPAVVVECGYLTNPADEAFITKEENQEKIARDILNAISKYASGINDSTVNAGEMKTLPSAILNDTLPEMYYKSKKVTGLKVVHSNNKIVATYADGTTEIITKEEAKKRGFTLPPPPPPVPAIAPVPPTSAVAPVPPPPPPPPPSLPDNALYLIDGKISSVAEVKLVAPEKIESINVLKGKDAVAIYGEKGKNGVIKIIMKNKGSGVITIHDATIKNQNGTGIITFKEGADVQANPLFILDGKEISKDEMSKISPASIESIDVLKDKSAMNKYGGKGKNGVVEITLKPGTVLKKDTIPDKLFTKVENEAAFPGGSQAWTKYIVTKITAVIDSLTEKDFGTCVVKFIVDKDGSITNVEATTMKDTRLAMIAVDAIKTGPKWIPATQNDHIVASYRLQPVTLTNPDKK